MESLSLKNEDREIREFDDKKLLREYFFRQLNVRAGIKERDIERTDAEKEIDKKNGFKGKFSRENIVERTFVSIGKLRAEIDRRGLQAPTTEEIDKMSEEEVNALFEKNEI